jgi:hypothetical protein
MTRYIAHMYTGMSGTDGWDALVADSLEEAEETAADMANDHASSYGIEQGMDEDDEMYCYGDVGASVEEYDPNKHDRYRSGGGSFVLDFEYLER